MLRKLLLGKIHRATVTRCDVDYVGSITIDADLLRASGIRPNEVVLVVDLDNGARFETYVIAGAAGSGCIEINGAAALLTTVGHKVIIFNFVLLDAAAVDQHVATVVLAGEGNTVAEVLNYPSTLADA